MKLELREVSPGYVVLTCRGGLSWEEREQLAAAVEEYLIGRDSLRGLVLDMAGVDFVNSAGLGALFQLVQRLRSRGGQLAFASVPPTIDRLLETVGMNRLAVVGEDVNEALALLGQPSATRDSRCASPWASCAGVPPQTDTDEPSKP